MQKQILYGLHSVESAIKHHPENILVLKILQDRRDRRIDELIREAKHAHISIEFAKRAALDTLTKQGNHQGVVAICNTQKSYNEKDLTDLLTTCETPPLILILDGVQDPHNLGACFRTADAAGVTAIIAPKDKSVGITSVVTKVASGATETIPFVQVTNLVRTIDELKSHGIWIYGLDADAKQSLYQTDLKTPIAFVLGSEGKGLRRLTREHCDELIHIPMLGQIESLNISVATAICLFESVRQRLESP